MAAQLLILGIKQRIDLSVRLSNIIAVICIASCSCAFFVYSDFDSVQEIVAASANEQNSILNHLESLQLFLGIFVAFLFEYAYTGTKKQRVAILFLIPSSFVIASLVEILEIRSIISLTEIENPIASNAIQLSTFVSSWVECALNAIGFIVLLDAANAIDICFPVSKEPDAQS